MALLETLTDGFDDNIIDSSKWEVYGGDLVEETGGELRITVGDGVAYHGIQSVDTYDLSDSFALVRIAYAGAIISMLSLETELKIIKDNGTNELYITISGGNTITAYKVVGGTTTEIGQQPYDPNVHKYLRIREDSGTVYWEYSTDGLTWTELGSDSTPFVITAVIGLIQAGNFEEETQTTTVRFDNFNIISSGLPDSNLINIKSIDRKEYSYKIYDSGGEFIGEWKDVTSELEYSQELNSPGSAIEVELARNSDTLFRTFDNRVTVAGDTRTTVAGDTRVASTKTANSIGAGTDVELGHKVEVYVFYGSQAIRQTVEHNTRVTVSGDVRVSDIGAPNGRRKFIGYISRYKLNYGESESVRVTLFSYGAELDNYILNDAGATTVSYTSDSPSNIFKDVLDKFTADGGVVDYDANSVQNADTVVSYTFRTNTVKEAIDKSLELAPTDWYWYLDMGTNIMHFKEKSVTPQHTFVLGKHFKRLDLEKTLEDLVNHVYFMGGDSGSGSNLLKEYSDNTSIASYGEGLNRYSDNRVTDTDSAEIIAQSLIDRNKDPVYRTQITILDTVYDIENINPGEIVGFTNFNNFIDGLRLQIVGISYEPNSVTLQLGSLLPSVPKRVQDIKRNLALQETENNPASPS